MLKITYLCVLVWAGEGVWSQWQVLRWEVSHEGRQWGRKEKQQLGEEMCEAGTNQEQFQGLFDHPTRSIQTVCVCFEYKNVHSYETRKHL